MKTFDDQVIKRYENICHIRKKYKLFFVCWIQENEEMNATLYAKSKEEIVRMFSAYKIVFIEKGV